MIWNAGTFAYYGGKSVCKIYWEYPVSSGITVGVKSTMSSSTIYTNNGEIMSFGYTLGPGETESSMQVTSIEPLNDTVYKYIVFPIRLNEGDNGEIGVNLYNYICEKYGYSPSERTFIEAKQNEIIYIGQLQVEQYELAHDGFNVRLRLIIDDSAYPLTSEGFLYFMEPLL